jgi:hypothetical protein
MAAATALAMSAYLRFLASFPIERNVVLHGL